MRPFLHKSHHRDLRRVAINLACMAMLMLFLLMTPTMPVLRGVASYAPLHTFLETLALLFAGLIFALGWNTRLGNISGNMVILACAFAGVAVLDMSHLLSFPGMPDYVTASDPEKAINFWLAARVLAAVSLLTVVSKPWRPLNKMAVRYWLLAAVLGYAGLMHWLFFTQPSLLPKNFIAGVGLTTYKIGIEYVFIGINLATVVMLLRQMRGPLTFNATSLLGAAMTMAMSEFCFTRYGSLNDIYNLAGHVYKIASYAFLYRVVFLESIERPYRELDAAQNDLRATLEAVPDLIFEMDLDGRYQHFRSAPSELLAMPPENFIGRTVFEVLPRQAAKVVMTALREAQETGRSLGHELQLALPAGLHWFELSVAHKMTLPGEPSRLVVLSRDITRRKLAEEDLGESQRTLEEAQKLARIGHYVIELNTALLTSSTVVDEIFGIDASFVKSQSQLALLIAPKQRASFIDRLHQAVTQDLPFEDVYKIMRPVDGEPCWASISGRLQYDADGLPAKLTGMVQDVTRRVASEQQLRLLEKAVAGLNDILLITEAEPFDEPGPRIVFVNDAFERRTGYSREEVIGKTPRLLQGEKTQRSELDRIRAALEKWEPVRAELINYTKTGEEFWIELDIMPIADATGWYTHWVAVERDISQRKTMEQLLAENAWQTQAILDNAADGIITIDRNGIIGSFNLAATKIFGYPAAEVIGQNIKMLMPQPYRAEHDGYLKNYDATGVTGIIGNEREAEGQHKSGSIFPVSLAISKIARNGQPLYIGLVRDITQRRESEAQIERLAFYDQLTSLPNRRLLLDRVTRALLASQRSGQFGALIFIDLDEFKSLNDTWGHEAGDQMLMQVGMRLTKCVREVDTVARLGGDEFVIVLENLGKSTDEAAAYAEAVGMKILSSFVKPFSLNERDHQSTASLGISLFGVESRTADEIMQRADSAMYQAKADGRNTYRFFDAELQARLDARSAMEVDLRQSMANKQLHLNYQPQIDRDGRVLGAEALIRWTHPVRGVVSPVQFIPLAEQSGFILDLGQWVMQTACLKLAEWGTSERTAALTMSVNVSARQFRHPQFVSQVIEAIAESRANPHLLKLELTESMLVDDVEDMIQKMLLLRIQGVSFSLDDFGTGYSSLSYLKRLPLDQLKIDQTFVRDVLNDPHDAAIARTVVALGKSLGLAVIAEGVETEGQRDFLEQNGCLAYQGYLFSRPLTADQFDTFVANRTPLAANDVDLMD